MRTLTALFLLAAVAIGQDTNIKPAFLGVGVEPVDARLRKMFKLSADVNGVMITALITPSAASRAGLRLGDVIVSLGDKKLANREQLVAVIRARKPGNLVAYEVRRGTGTISGKLKLGIEEEGTHMAHLRTDPEPPPPPKAKAKARVKAKPKVTDRKADDELSVDERLDRVSKDLDELKKKARARQKSKAKAKAPKGKPRNLTGWIAREERMLKQARQNRAERRIAYHEARLSVLREMRQAEMRLPTARLDRVEKKLDEILATLRKMRR